MAIIQAGRTGDRRGYVGKAFILKLWRGLLHAQAWPRKRGKPKQQWQKAALDRLRIQQQFVKFTPAEEYEVMNEGLTDFLRENEGVRGTAAIRLRDWLTAMQFGRAFAWVFPDGRTAYPAPVVQDASDILDWIEPRLGSVLTHAAGGWLPTSQCAPGKVLCCLSELPIEGACPPASRAEPAQAVGGI